MTNCGQDTLDNELSLEEKEILAVVYEKFIDGVSKITLYQTCTLPLDTISYYRYLYGLKRNNFIIIDEEGCVVLTEAGKEIAVTALAEGEAICQPVPVRMTKQEDRGKVKTGVNVTHWNKSAQTDADFEKSEILEGVGTIRLNKRRDTYIGVVLYCLMVYRNYKLTMNEISNIVNVTKSSLTGLMVQLKACNAVSYATESDVKGAPVYFQWNGNFDYPFEVALINDRKLLKYTPEQWEKVKHKYVPRVGRKKPAEVSEAEIKARNVVRNKFNTVLDQITEMSAETFDHMLKYMRTKLDEAEKKRTSVEYSKNVADELTAALFTAKK